MNDMDEDQNIMLSRKSLTKKNMYCVILFIWSSKTTKTNL